MRSETIKTPTFLYYIDSDSVLGNIPFVIKLFVFLVISVFALSSSNPLHNLSISVILFSVLVYTGFVREKKGQFKSFIVPIILFSSFWLLLSRVEGSLVYVTYPWGAYVTERTFELMLLAISKWILILLSGMMFLVTTSENELIETLGSIGLPESFIYMSSIAFNTVGFAIRDLENIENALFSRGYKSNTIFKKLKKMFYLSSVSLLSNLKKIDTMNQSFIMMSGKAERDTSEMGGSIEVFIRKLSYEDEAKPLVKNLKFSVSKGEILGIYGKTGSGKTSILKTISGIMPNVQPASIDASTSMDGKEISFQDMKALISIGFQEPESQFIFNTVEKEIFSRIDPKKRDIAEKLLDYFEIRHLLEKSVRDISTGQRKLVLIVSVLSQDKDIILLDEPTANLDQHNKEKLFSALEMIKKDKIIIISTHDRELVPLCDKYLLFDDIERNWKYANVIPKGFFDIDEKFRVTENRVQSKDEEKMITLKDVSYSFPDNTEALRNLSFTIDKCDIIGILGKNGSGKTSLINVITGKLQPSSGVVIHHSAIGKLGFIHQEPQKQLFSDSVKNELIFESESEISQEKVEHMLDMTKLNGLENEHPFFISRGQKQLLLISAVLMSNPEFIIIDEPFTGMDDETSHKILNLILEYYNEKRPTIIFTDQTGDMLKHIITKKLVLDRGCLIKYSM